MHTADSSEHSTATQDSKSSAMWAQQENDYEASRGQPTIAIWNDLMAG